jgi:hypothetical protein
MTWDVQSLARATGVGVCCCLRVGEQFAGGKQADATGQCVRAIGSPGGSDQGWRLLCNNRK